MDHILSFILLFLWVQGLNQIPAHANGGHRFPCLRKRKNSHLSRCQNDQASIMNIPWQYEDYLICYFGTLYYETPSGVSILKVLLLVCKVDANLSQQLLFLQNWPDNQLLVDFLFSQKDFVQFVIVRAQLNLNLNWKWREWQSNWLVNYPTQSQKLLRHFYTCICLCLKFVCSIGFKTWLDPSMTILKGLWT